MTSSSSPLALLLAGLTACGAAPARTETPAATATDIAGARAFVGPFATWDEICGAPVETPEAGEVERRERCSVRVRALSDGGPFEAMATYFEGTGFDGSASLALKTERGWFVPELPDGAPFGGGLSHHTPASSSFDADATRLEGGALRVVERGSSASFAPGRGPLGSTSREWTAVTRCGLRGGTVVCGEPERVWSRTCHVADAPSGTTGEPLHQPIGERTCEETGEDVR